MIHDPSVPAPAEPAHRLHACAGNLVEPLATPAEHPTGVQAAGEPAVEGLPSAPECEPLSADAAGIVEPADADASTDDEDAAPSPSGPYLPFRDLLEGPPVRKDARADLFGRWASMLRDQGFANSQVRQILWQVGQRRCVPRLSTGEFEDLLGDHDGRRGGVEPKDVVNADPVLAPGVDPGDAEARREALMQPESFPWNSLGNAKRFVHMFGGRIRYAQDEKCWFVWNGRTWQRDAQMEVRRLYRQMVEAMFVVASLIPPGQTPGEERRRGRLRREFIVWIHKSQARKVEDDSIQQARAEADVSGGMGDFDRDEDLLSVANGTIDLRTGVLRPHDPADRITRFVDIAYDPAADCPAWKAFLLAIQGNDAAMVDYLQRALGYSMTADVREQCMFVCKGEGANGKSTLLNVVMAVLGEYAATTDRNLLVLSRRDHPASIHALRNIRLAVTSEAEQDEYLSESLIKQMTGERDIQARGMGQDFVRIPITWKLWLTTNHPPKIRGSDFGIRRRIRVIPFDVRFDGDRDDKTLFNKLMAERGGILAWLVAGCLAWRSAGLQPPEKIARATEDLFDEQGRLGSFIRDCVRARAGARISGEQFFAAYKTWCLRAGVTKLAMLDATEFGERMALKYTRKKSHGVRVYHDIEIPIPVVKALLNPGVPEPDGNTAGQPDMQASAAAHAGHGPAGAGAGRPSVPAGVHPLASGGDSDLLKGLPAWLKEYLGKSRTGASPASPAREAKADPHRR